MAALGKLAVAALIGFALLFVSTLARFGFFLPVLIFAVIALFLAGVVATGWRWIAAGLVGLAGLVLGAILVAAN